MQRLGPLGRVLALTSTDELRDLPMLQPNVVTGSGKAYIVATPDEIAGAAGFLLGPKAAFLTGTDLLIDGGTIAAMRGGTYEGRRDRR